MVSLLHIIYAVAFCPRNARTLRYATHAQYAIASIISTHMPSPMGVGSPRRWITLIFLNIYLAV